MLIDRFLNLRFFKRTATGLAVLLGMAGSVWLIEGTIAPKIVQAYETRVDVGLDRLPNESYDTLLRRAEQVARAAAQRSFDRDILISQVSVIVIGRNQGSEAPVLTLDVSRDEWRSRPDTRRWATYYKTAASLLGFSGSAPVTFGTPVQNAPVQSAPLRSAPVPSFAPNPAPTMAPATPQTPLPPNASPANPTGTTPNQRVSPNPPAQDEDADSDDEEQ